MNAPRIIKIITIINIVNEIIPHIQSLRHSHEQLSLGQILFPQIRVSGHFIPQQHQQLSQHLSISQSQQNEHEKVQQVK